MKRQLTERGAEAVFDELEIDAALVWCNPDGTERRGSLLWVVVEKVEVEGGAQKWLERGGAPRMNPRAKSWEVRHLTGPEPVLFLMVVQEAR